MTAGETSSAPLDASAEARRVAPANGASVGQLMTDLSDQLVRLVRDELQLARVELTKSAKHAGLGIGLFGAAGVLALFGLAGLIATAMIALALLLPWWLSALIISVAVLVVAGILALVGKSQAGKAPEPAEQVIDSVKADVDAVKEVPRHDHTARA